jgi:hypothetical protein
MIVAGDVVSVRPAGHGRMVTELAVDEWVKPASGRRLRRSRLPTWPLRASTNAGSRHARVPAGGNVDPASLPGWEFGDRMIKKIKRSVPPSRTIECPYGPA